MEEKMAAAAAIAVTAGISLTKEDSSVSAVVVKGGGAVLG